MQIGLIKIWPVDNNKTLKGKADVSLITDQGELSMKGFRIVRTDDKTIFVAPPQEKYVINGVTKYKDILWLDRLFQKFLYSQILTEFQNKN